MDRNVRSVEDRVDATIEGAADAVSERRRTPRGAVPLLVATTVALAALTSGSGLSRTSLALFFPVPLLALAGLLLGVPGEHPWRTTAKVLATGTAMSVVVALAVALSRSALLLGVLVAGNLLLGAILCGIGVVGLVLRRWRNIGLQEWEIRGLFGFALVLGCIVISIPVAERIEARRDAGLRADLELLSRRVEEVGRDTGRFPDSLDPELLAEGPLRDFLGSSEAERGGFIGYHAFDSGFVLSFSSADGLMGAERWEYEGPGGTWIPWND